MDKIQACIQVDRYRALVGRARLHLKLGINERGTELYIVNCGMFRRWINGNSGLPLANDNQKAFWAHKIVEAARKEEAAP